MERKDAPDETRMSMGKGWLHRRLALPRLIQGYVIDILGGLGLKAWLFCACFGLVDPENLSIKGKLEHDVLLEDWLIRFFFNLLSHCEFQNYSQLNFRHIYIIPTTHPSISVHLPPPMSPVSPLHCLCGKPPIFFISFRLYSLKYY